MNHYNHLTLEERECILKYHILNYSITEIAKRLNRSKSTISRELKRHRSQDGSYSACKAHNEYLKNRLKSRRKKILSDSIIFEFVKEKFLVYQWSPEEIQGRLRLENAPFTISYSTIYRAIYAGLFDKPNLSSGNRGAIRKLRHRGKSRHTKNYEEKRGKIPISHMIDERPSEANNRSRLGDWEADTVIGKTGRACLVTLVDRHSRYLIGGKVARKKADEVNEVILKALKDQPLKSITPDRGKEFAKHAEITKALDEVQFYFPLPHHPWQRGTNENTNGLLREYFPKRQDITDTSEEYIQSIFDKINRRPRKILGYKTPYEVYHSTSLRLI